jgi:hypothetical protein
LLRCCAAEELAKVIIGQVVIQIETGTATCVDSFGERLYHDMPDDGTIFAAGMVQDVLFGEKIVDTSKALARHNDDKLHRPSLLCEVLLASALERVNTAPSLP